MPLFELKDFTFTYPTRKEPALQAVNLRINSGEFVVVCGKSGCGKSTLLRQLKTVLTPHGSHSGEVLFHDKALKDADLREQTAKIGFVLQSPENQIVTDKVWHELAFGLESLGVDSQTIRLRVAEMANFFGIEAWFHRDVNTLSGGQKQLLNLAGVMAMQPEVLILDEPTSQLDPIAASEFLKTLKKINEELGVAILLTEHRLEEVFPLANRIVVMDKGSILADAPPREISELLKDGPSDMFAAMPAPVQIYASVKNRLPCPLTVRDGRQWLNHLFENKEIKYRTSSTEKDTPAPSSDEPAIKLKEVWFRYEKSSPDVVKDLSLSIPKGQLFCLMGGNGAGKTTALNLLCGIYRSQRGKIELLGKNLAKYSATDLFDHMLAMLPQNPQALFVKNTVRLDLREVEADEQKIAAISELVQITDLLDCHPYDLSGGEQQRAALAKVLLTGPKVLLLDEPTKGIDSYFKLTLAQILKKLTQSGVTIVMVSHDIEFCAKYADRCALFFNGNIVTENTANRFFSGNSFYTTAANRMARHLFTDAVTNEDVIALCKQNLE
jgi:energy-coupling factor transport system ATP-binding protein